jgi:hypothetical protein
MRKSLGTLVDCYSPLPYLGLTQMSELKDEGVPEDPRGLLQPPPPPDLGLTQVNVLKMRKTLGAPFPDMDLTQVSELKDEVPEDLRGLFQPRSRYGSHPGE